MFTEKYDIGYDDNPEFHCETLVLRHSDPDVKKINDKAKKIELKYTKGIGKLLGGDSTAINLNAATFIVHGAVEKAAHSIQLSRSELDKNALIEELSEIISTYLFSEKEGTCDDDT